MPDTAYIKENSIRSSFLYFKLNIDYLGVNPLHINIHNRLKNIGYLVKIRWIKINHRSFVLLTYPPYPASN